ncbi:MAG: FKBP-type peptidyl-prolyl cis-trans isomerase [Bacteroidales bacterium]|nr:FKBP-type peptidyl-prolyl cis-trans isomerase [Bacteroidales bacterium]
MAIAFVFLGACKNNEKADEKVDEKVVDKQEKVEKVYTIDDYLKDNNIAVEPTSSGLYYIETEAGTGEQAKPGDIVVVHYKGTLLDGTKFDASYDRGEPFEFKLGAGEVIKGWDEGIALMKVGGKATLILPSDLAYGNRAVGGVIPANSPLLFDVELVGVK